MNLTLSRSLLALTLAASALLAGCSSPKTLYQWEDYQPQVYEYFKGEEPKEAQAEVLERDLQKIRSTGKAGAAGLPRAPGPAVPEHGQGRSDGAAVPHRESAVPRVRPVHGFSA